MSFVLSFNTQANAELTKKLQLAEEKIKSYETKDTETVAYTREQAEKLKQISENLVKLQEVSNEQTHMYINFSSPISYSLIYAVLSMPVAPLLDQC